MPDIGAEQCAGANKAGGAVGANVSEANNFVRSLTPEQMEQYKNIKGPGSRQRKQEFLKSLSELKLKDHAGNQQQISSDSQTEQKVMMMMMMVMMMMMIMTMMMMMMMVLIMIMKGRLFSELLADCSKGGWPDG